MMRKIKLYNMNLIPPEVCNLYVTQHFSYILNTYRNV